MAHNVDAPFLVDLVAAVSSMLFAAFSIGLSKIELNVFGRFALSDHPVIALTIFVQTTGKARSDN